MKHNMKLSIKEIAAWIAIQTARGGGIPSAMEISRRLNVSIARADAGRNRFFANRKKV